MPLPLNPSPPQNQFPRNIQNLRSQITTVSWRLRRTIVFRSALAPLGLWVGLVLTLATGGRASDRPAGEISG